MVETAHYKTALEHFNINQQEQKSDFKVQEVHDYAFIILRGRNDDFISKCRKHSIVIPRKALRLEANQEDRAHKDKAALTLWISPDEFLHLTPLAEKDELVILLEQELSHSFSAVVDNSGGYVWLKLTGNQTQSILAKVCAYDLTAQNFPQGKVVSSLLGKAPCIFFNRPGEGISLLIRCSYADYVWRLLEDAGKEYSGT